MLLFANALMTQVYYKRKCEIQTPKEKDHAKCEES